MSHIEPTLERLHETIAFQDQIIEEQRQEIAALRDLVAAADIPTAYHRSDANGHRVVRCGYCQKYIRQNHLSQHLLRHEQVAQRDNDRVDPLKLWGRR